MSLRTDRCLLTRYSLFAVLALSGIWLRAAGNGVAGDANRVTVDTWGGEHVILEVSKSGAEIEFDCARGQITKPMVLDKRGDFVVPGTFTYEHGGPVLREDETKPPIPALYSGHVAGDIMNLTVTLGKEKRGTFTLNRGVHANLRKCL